MQINSGVSFGGTALTNQTAEYDPATDTWSLLPNSNEATWRARGSCGMCGIGGGTVPDITQGLLRSGEVLPGFEQCNDSAPVPRSRSPRSSNRPRPR